MLRSTIAVLVGLVAVPTAFPQVVIVPPGPQIGSSNPITATAPVAHPPGTPCTVPLFSEYEFANFNYQTFNYTPPANCPGPWAKVVFSADFTVTAGTQYDRTAAFYIAHANVYYGTTAEPSTMLSPSWHVENDVTDLSSLLTSPQSGEADLGNFVGTSGGVNYNGIIYANAALEFYPVAPGQAPPQTPDLVIPMPDAPGGAATLGSTTSQLSQSVTLPLNTERVFLDVIAQSQSNDEFWYTCVPNDVAAELGSCGNTAFRETEVSIDGQPAGVAPVYPWIYTGGIDPFLWQPIVGVQTVDFNPFRVDLTPFAGLLADGQPHTVAISVFNADNYFLATANLLVELDHNATQVTGSLVENTLAAAPSPVVKENLQTGASGNLSGTVEVAAGRAYEISGYVDTSHGRVTTTIGAHVDFSNRQQFLVSSAVYEQNITQSTHVDTTTTVNGAGTSSTVHTEYSYPFTLQYGETAGADGGFSQKTTVDQRYLSATSRQEGGSAATSSRTTSQVSATDTLAINSSGNLAGHGDQSSSAQYVQSSASGHCFARKLGATAGVLTSASTTLRCSSDGAPNR
jgi:hypothetical protein